jgi:hypothetical protein
MILALLTLKVLMMLGTINFDLNVEQLEKVDRALGKLIDKFKA